MFRGLLEVLKPKKRKIQWGKRIPDNQFTDVWISETDHTAFIERKHERITKN